jgi:hypothetical protein
VLDAQRLFRLSQCDREVNAVRGTRRHNVAAGRSPPRGRSNGDPHKASSATPSSSRAA